MNSGFLQNSLYSEESSDINDNIYLVFRLSDESFAVSIFNVTEIIRLIKITPIPNVYSFMKGVINIRGKVIPIMDARLRMGKSERAYDDRTCVIIVTVNNLDLGIIVDQVVEVLSIPQKNIEPPPSIESGDGGQVDQNRFISGIGNVGTDLKIIIDLQKLIFSYDSDNYKVGIIDAT